MAAAQPAHWTRRLIRYCRPKGSVWRGACVTVYKDSEGSPNLQQGHIHVGAHWLQKQFPFCYAGFMASLLKGKHMNRWHDKGHVMISEFNEKTARDKAVRERDMNLARAKEEDTWQVHLHSTDEAFCGTKYAKRFTSFLEDATCNRCRLRGTSWHDRQSQ